MVNTLHAQSHIHKIQVLKGKETAENKNLNIHYFYFLYMYHLNITCQSYNVLYLDAQMRIELKYVQQKKFKTR